MNSRPFGHSLFLVLALLVATAPAAHADKCTSAKLKAIAKRESGLLACSAKSAKTGDASGEAACIGKVTAKFDAAFAKAGTCTGIATDCGTIVDDQCVPGVLQLLPDAGPSDCEAARLKASGKRASSALSCFTKKPDDQAGCQAKTDDKFVASFDKVSGCGGDGQAAAVGTSIDASCVQAVVTTDGSGAVTGLCPTTTTTTTTTTLCTALPPGSYQGTCTGCTACSGTLHCLCAPSAVNPSTCQFLPGDCTDTTLPLPCGDVSNCNGVLRCGAC